MNYQPVFERLSIQAEDLFRQATFEEFFGGHLFESRDQHHYLFPSDEKGDAVCLLEKRPRNEEQEYEEPEVEYIEPEYEEGLEKEQEYSEPE